jgi:hypothetical protein
MVSGHGNIHGGDRDQVQNALTSSKTSFFGRILSMVQRALGEAPMGQAAHKNPASGGREAAAVTSSHTVQAIKQKTLKKSVKAGARSSFGVKTGLICIRCRLIAAFYLQVFAM